MCKIFYFGLIFLVIFAGSVRSQFRQITEFLNNVTITDLSALLRRLPVPNPLLFDGLPIYRNDITYHLYTQENPTNPEILKQTSIRFGSFDPKNEIKFLIHGWMESANRSFYGSIVEEYLKRGNYNVIGVDWSRPALNEYSLASRNTKTAGRELGDFIIRLQKLFEIPFEQFHILGHSLGAHLAGFAGKWVFARTGFKIGRITSLDAAGPLFETPIPVGRNMRIDKDDAQFVDGIHTDGGVFGMMEAIGHVDFYPNGGVPRQPGCSLINVQQLSSKVILDDSPLLTFTKIQSLISFLEGIKSTIQHTSSDILHSLGPVFCSHSRSHVFYAETINSDKLIATECNSYESYRVGLCNGRNMVQMGEDVDQNVRGKYYLTTNSAPPFGRG